MKVTVESVRLPVTGEAVDEVTAAIHAPSRPSGGHVFLTHGAGGDLDTPGLVALADAIAGEGRVVVRTNLPYREAGRRNPPRATTAVSGFMTAFEAARARLGPMGGWIAGGKSFGGRVASLAAAEGLDVEGLLFYGYPLHPPGKPDRLRVDHWPHVPVPCLFLQGTRDTFCDLDLLDANLRKLPRRATVQIVKGGDHSLRIAKKASTDGRVHTPEDVIGQLGPVVADWITTLE